MIERVPHWVWLTIGALLIMFAVCSAVAALVHAVTGLENDVDV